RQAFCHRLARKQPGADHDVGVRRVGAGGDRGNDDVAVAEVVRAAFNRDSLRRAGLGEILVERGRERRMEMEDVLTPVAAFVELFLHRHGEAGLDVLERVAALVTLGPGRLRPSLVPLGLWY